MASPHARNEHVAKPALLFLFNLGLILLVHEAYWLFVQSPANGAGMAQTGLVAAGFILAALSAYAIAMKRQSALLALFCMAGWALWLPFVMAKVF